MQTPFIERPRLPAVPPPIAGETLSGWISCLAAIYGLTTDSLLRRMGAFPPRRSRWLDIAPSSGVLAKVSEQTGVAVAFMREKMTFHRLGRELMPTVLASRPLCPSCVNEAHAGGRMTERLHWIAPWRFACERHPIPVSREELDGAVDGAAMLRDVALFSERLEAAAFRDPSQPFPSIARSSADCIRLVRGINDRVRLRASPGRDGGAAIFEVRDIRSGPDETIAPERRNRRVLSAWYAWHVMTNPEGVIFQHTRSAARQQARALAVLLAGFLPGEQMLAAWRRGTALHAAAQRQPADPDDNAARQAGLLRGAMITTPEDRSARSPFEYPDFGRRFVPAFYLPGSALAARCGAIPLRAASWPPAPSVTRPPSARKSAPLRSPPSPAALAPYVALIDKARAELAARGGRACPGELERLAFRLLRQGAATSLPGTGAR